MQVKKQIKVKQPYQNYPGVLHLQLLISSRDIFYVRIHMKTKAAAIRTLLIITNQTSSQIVSFHSSWFNSSNSLKFSQADLPSFSHLHWWQIFGSGLPSDLLHAKFPLHLNCIIPAIIETLLWHPAFNAVLVTYLLALQARKFPGSFRSLLRLSRAFFLSMRAFFLHCY